MGENFYRGQFLDYFLSDQVINDYEDEDDEDELDMGAQRVRTAKDRFLEEISDTSQTALVKRMHEAYASLGDDDYDSGDTIRFLKRFGENDSWWYVAIKNNNGKWNMSGGRIAGPTGCTWHELKVWLASTGEPTSTVDKWINN